MILKVEEKNVSDLKDWFYDYVSSFQTNDAEICQAINLKKEHTERVCQEILDIGKALALNDNELRLLSIMGLLHDVGRFDQFVHYHTFVDGKSEDHAQLAVKIINQHGILIFFDKSTRQIILKTIKYHNRASLPVNETDNCLFFTKLLRDADKLDIWRVVTDYYQKKNCRRNGAIELDLPDTNGYAEGVYSDLMNQSIVDMRHLKNLNDFKLLQLGWVFDVNFAPTFSLIQSRRYKAQRS